MRISVNPWDQGYDNFYGREKVRVYLDGVEQKFCVTADEEQGFVVRYVVSEGKLTTDSTGQMLEQEVIKGKVVIEP